MQKDSQHSETELENLLKQSIAEGFVEVPILPEIANKAFMLANNKESDASQMAQLIQSDPSLAGHVMRIANSAAYTPMANLTSLQQAIARLGMTTISEIAISAVINAKLFNTPGYEDYADLIWQQSLATSLWAKEVASHCNVNVEVAFLAGLIHSIGRPAVLQTLIDLAEQRNLPLNDEIVHQLEDNYWLIVSQMIVIRWRMPALVIETIQHIETPSTDKEAGQLAAVVNMARYAADAMLNDELADNFPQAAIDIVEFESADIQKLLTKKEQISERLTQLMA
ncbi:MAG TPA: HDOD domain-containing protein [Methylophaga sp.]|uniref:HDOD domain-containing protein n=1 Tax=unclassified Methylophaga TaxID=2629249 RepID=UPI000C8BBD7C|nr:MULTISPECIES: HDOD domain-containing protein [unclassified Methylophaga]MAP26390.1 HDOD domain-containing protein [Methylophaga sp.]HAD32294.1 HDOD domain-containing protein [Methylophaga sp.]HCO00143.1 HDOD domain-containing protein [Methylophaga sp.]